MLDATQLVKELQEMRDDGHLSDALLRYAVRNIENADPRFDWVGVYLVDAEKNDVWLHNYVGSPTEHSRIPLGTGVMGRAVTEGKDSNVADLSEVEDRLDDDPDMAAELVVLIRAGEDVFGVIDLDSSEKGAFGDEDEAALRGVADKLAEQLAAERR